MNLAAATAFLKARLSERSSRIQLAVLVLLALTASRVVTMEQLQGLSGQTVAILAMVGPLLGFLNPDPEKGVAPEAVAKAVDGLAKVAEAKLAAPEVVAKTQGVVDELSKALADAGVDTDALVAKVSS